MILAGIDEAGLGPRIGPLVTACAAFAVPDSWQPDTPWKRFADVITDTPGRKETRTAIADSKLVYTSGGMPALETALGAMVLLLCGSFPPSCRFSDGQCHPCYSRAIHPFPNHADEAEIRRVAAECQRIFDRKKARAVHLEAHALFEPLLNHRFESGLNKNQALLMETGGHLARLVELFPDDALLIMVDKQGGRNDYLPFLTALLPGYWLDTLAVGAEESAYRVRRRGGDVVIRFRAKADRTSFPTALASLAAKYTRERCMAELNAWFCAALEGLKPTAGYPGDAERWLKEVEASGRSDELRLNLLLRAR